MISNNRLQTLSVYTGWGRDGMVHAAPGQRTLGGTTLLGHHCARGYQSPILENIFAVSLSKFIFY